MKILDRYMRDARRTKLVSIEEQAALAAQAQAGNGKALADLVAMNAGLVISVVRSYARGGVDMADLLNEGNLGVMKAAQSYNPTKGASFPTWATKWISAYARRFAQDNGRPLKVGGRIGRQPSILRNAIKALEERGEAVTDESIARETNMQVFAVRNARHALAALGVSTSAPLGDDDNGATVGDVIPDAAPSVEMTLAQDSQAEQIARLVEAFARRCNFAERQVIEHRIMAREDEAWTFQDVADACGVSRQRAQQIESKIAPKLHTFLREALAE